MTWQSWQFNELSQGLVPIPMWIPQIGMALGTAVLFLAMGEKLVDVARGGEFLKGIDAKDAHIER